MPTMDIIFTVSFKFIDCCDRSELDEIWNTGTFEVIEFHPMHLNSQNDFLLALRLGLSNAKEPHLKLQMISEASEMAAIDWFRTHKDRIDELRKQEHSIWFSLGLCWRLKDTPWMFPKPKKIKDKRGRLHVQFN